MKNPKVGCIDYINVLPVYLGLERGFIPACIEVVRESPVRLNRLLARGSLDLSAVPSIEYARNQDRYLLLRDLSLCCTGKVGSVLLFSREELTALNGQKIAIIGASATSRVLLEILLREVYALDFTPVQDGLETKMLLQEYTAALLIGDDALLASRLGGFRIYDLGELWTKSFGLPMVYALWAVRRLESSGEKKRLLEVADALRKSRDWGERHLDLVVQEAGRRTGLSGGTLRRYFRHLDFHLGRDELEGLKKFFDMAARLGLAPSLRRIEFLEDAR